MAWRYVLGRVAVGRYGCAAWIEAHALPRPPPAATQGRHQNSDPASELRLTLMKTPPSMEDMASMGRNLRQNARRASFVYCMSVRQP